MTTGEKQRSRADWEQGHHGSKSSRTTTNLTAPQMVQTSPNSEGAATTSQEAAALQASLLDALNHAMYGDSQCNINCKYSIFFHQNILLRSTVTPVFQMLSPLSSDHEQSTPRAPSLPLSEVSIQALLDTCGRNPLSASQVPSHSKGKERSTDQGEQVTAPDEHWIRPNLPQTEFSAPNPIPHSFSTSMDPFTVPSQPGPSVQPAPQDGPGPNTGDPQSHGASLAPLLSYFSELLNSMFTSFERSHTSSTRTIMEGISAIQEDLKASRIDTNTSRDVEMQDVDKFPLKVTRHPKKPHNFVPSDPTSDIPMESDIEEHKYFATCIQLHALHLLKITDYKYLNNIKCVLTSDEVAAYEQDIPSYPEVTPTNFIIDCAHGKDTPYNREVFMVFADDFLDKVNNHGWYTSQTIPEQYCKFDIVYGAFKAHFTYIKSHYNEVIIAPSKDPVKAKEDVKARLCKSSHTSRKVQLLKMRLDAMVENPKLQKHLPLVKYLGTQGISSDESKDEARRTISYPRMYPRWCSQQLSALMWEADLAILEFLSITIGKHKKAGMQLRNRLHSAKFNDAAAAPPGLPVNCYDAAWLSSLHLCSKKHLRVREEEYDFAPGCTGGCTANSAGSSVPLGTAGANSNA
ncbi:hypothetical protein EDD17DRAFT_1752500 [Pisolithus thermaeus]|nr:hypothetical protein EV401DRAFT_2084509 [Pisolithus croceorrhizus]KAI6167152.1 hypothetical protein EDD17DRAFT_1752500 [Pisolithus thermaeus]